MNAAVLSSYGATDVIQHVKDRPVPVLEPDQVLIRVRACALAPLDTQVRPLLVLGPSIACVPANPIPHAALFASTWCGVHFTPQSELMRN